MNGLQLPLLGKGQAEWLKIPFEKEEVKKVAWLLDGDKAPGPDGFTFAFYKSCWEVIRGELNVGVKRSCWEVIRDKLNVGVKRLPREMLPRQGK